MFGGTTGFRAAAVVVALVGLALVGFFGYSKVSKPDGKLQNALPVTLMWASFVIAIPNSTGKLKALTTRTNTEFLRNELAGGAFGLEIVLWAACIAAIVLYAKRWKRLPLPVAPLAVLWVLVTLSTLQQGVVLLAPVLGAAVLIGLGLGVPDVHWLLKHTRYITRTLCAASIVLLIVAPRAATWKGTAGILTPWFGINRMQGILHHANYFGPAMAIALVLEVAAFKLRSTSLLWVGLAAFELAASSSRTSWGAAVVGLVAVAVVSRSTGRLRARWLRIGVPVAIGVTMVGAVGSYFVLGFDKLDEILSSRMSLWADIIPRLFERPLLGYGDHPLNIMFPNSENLNHCHNQFFQSLLESGLPGLLALLAVLAGCFIAFRNPELRSLRIALFAVVFTDMFFEVPLSLPMQGSSFLVIFVVLLAGARSYGREGGMDEVTKADAHSLHRHAARSRRPQRDAVPAPVSRSEATNSTAAGRSPRPGLKERSDE
jgi:hypothetical protein